MPAAAVDKSIVIDIRGGGQVRIFGWLYNTMRTTQRAASRTKRSWVPAYWAHVHQAVYYQGIHELWLPTCSMQRVARAFAIEAGHFSR